mgnify:CR=1 FL=1
MRSHAPVFHWCGIPTVSEAYILWHLLLWHRYHPDKNPQVSWGRSGHTLALPPPLLLLSSHTLPLRKHSIKHHQQNFTTNATRPQGQDQFIKIAYAYEILGDETKRARYDAGGFAAATEFAAQAPNWDTWQPPEAPSATVFEEW